jgi:hypothetical protein
MCSVRMRVQADTGDTVIDDPGILARGEMRTLVQPTRE